MESHSFHPLNSREVPQHGMYPLGRPSLRPIIHSSILSSAKFRFPRTRRETPPAPRMWTSLNTARRHHMFLYLRRTEI